MIGRSAEENRDDFLHKSHEHIEVSSHLGSALAQGKIILRIWRTQKENAWCGSATIVFSVPG